MYIYKNNILCVYSIKTRPFTVDLNFVFIQTALTSKAYLFGGLGVSHQIQAYGAHELTVQCTR